MVKFIVDSESLKRTFEKMDNFRSEELYDPQSLVVNESLANPEVQDTPLNKKDFLIKILIVSLLIVLPYLAFVELYLKEEKINGSEAYLAIEEEFWDSFENPSKYPEYGGNNKEYLDVYIALINYDDRADIATYRIDLAPSPALGSWESGGTFWFYKSISLDFDSVDVGSVGDFDANKFYGSFEISVIGTNLFEGEYSSSNYFPFEQRYSKLKVLAYKSESNKIEEAYELNNFEDLPIRVQDYTGDYIEGYKLYYDYLDFEDSEYNISNDVKLIRENLDNGIANLYLTIKRDRSTIFSVFALMTFVVGAAIALVLMTLVVWSKRRPPALASLIWGAATIFAIIETRRFIPNTPRVGVYMDLYFFFPSILLSIFATSSLFALWIRRKDWVA